MKVKVKRKKNNNNNNIMLISSTIYVLISNALQSRREITILLSRSVMYMCLIFSLTLLLNYSIKLLESGISLYNGLFFVKPYISGFTIFIFSITMLILILTSYYPRKKLSAIPNSEYNSSNYVINKNLEQYRIMEYSLLILFVLNGGTLLMASNDLVSIFLSIELQSYGLYLLCAVYRDSELSSKAALTYFLLGGLSSCIILLGQSLIYVNTGNTNLDGLYIISNISDTINYNLSSNSNFINVYQYYIQTSILVFSIGFLFKISSAPFHNWSPDVYDQIPTIVTTFVAIVAKISILIMFFELVYYTTQGSFNISWRNNILLSALLSLVIGSILGLTQTRIKRLYAYSTISHLGFILLSLSVISIESSMAFFFYIVQYSITNLNAFFILIATGYSLYTFKKETKVNDMSVDNSTAVHDHQPIKTENNIIYSSTELSNIMAKENNKPYVEQTNYNESKQIEQNRNYSPIQLVSELSNYYKINTYLALSLGLTLFSFLGVPPLIGFFGKQMVLSAALDRGYVFMVLIAIITSVISAVYYLIIIKVIFFDSNSKYNYAYALADKELYEDKSTKLNVYEYIKFDKENINLSGSLSNTISLINLIIIQFMFISKGKISLFLLLSLFNLQ